MSQSYLGAAKRGKFNAARVALSLLIILFMWQVVGAIPYLILVIDALLNPNSGMSISYDTMSLTGGNSLVNYVAINCTFLFFLIGIFLSVRYIHKIPFRSLITPLPKVNGKKILVAFCVYGGFIALTTGVEVLLGTLKLQYVFDAKPFLIALPIILIMTPIQTTTEEIFFRGYVLIGFGTLLRNRIALSVISGLIFMTPHLLNPEVFAAFGEGVIPGFMLVAYYFTVGFTFSMVTLLTNSLESSIGAHAANNLFAFLLVGYANSAIPTKTVFFQTGGSIPLEFVLLLVTSAFFCLIMYKYHTRGISQTSSTQYASDDENEQEGANESQAPI